MRRIALARFARNAAHEGARFAEGNRRRGQATPRARGFSEMNASPAARLCRAVRPLFGEETHLPITIGWGPGSPRPLPHHRTCGSASGGSRRVPETAIWIAEAREALLCPVAVRQRPLEDSGARDAPVAPARACPLTGRSLGDTERTQVAPPRSGAPPFLPTHLPQPPAQPRVEPFEGVRRVGVREIRRPADREAVDRPDAPFHRDAPAARGQLAQTILGPFPGFRIDPHLHLTLPVEEAEAQQGPLRRRGNRRLLAVDAQPQPPLDVPRGAVHDAQARPFA